MSEKKSSDTDLAALAADIRRDVEKVLVVTVDSKTGEIMDATVQRLDGFILAVAEAVEKQAQTGEPIKLRWEPSGSGWWRPSQ